uniref:Uncharacterized protein n=1 Tax=Rhizophora mucronata TaxID=61149 RepID=A0A2P2IMN6_RHIMU
MYITLISFVVDLSLDGLLVPVLMLMHVVLFLCHGSIPSLLQAKGQSLVLKY